MPIQQSLTSSVLDSLRAIGWKPQPRLGQKKRVMSAAARAKMAKAQKERWAKFRAAKAKGKN